MTTKDLRTYPRINTLLPVSVRLLKPNEYGMLNCRVTKDNIVIDDLVPPPLKDEVLNLWLNMLNTKLDYLIRQNSPKRKEVELMNCKPLNISGSGMSLLVQESFNIGNILEIRMVLRTYPPKIIYLYGEIVRIEDTCQKDKSHIISLNFWEMKDEVRNEILKFDYKKHRQKLMTCKES